MKNEQEKIFEQGEGDNWFKRNKDYIRKSQDDWIEKAIEKLDLKENASIIECGCSSGHRLARLKKILPNSRVVGFDISKEAICYGKKEYSEIELYQHKISEEFDIGQYDVVICNFVLHWVDRQDLSRVISNIDKLVANGGVLLIGDFLPDYNHKNKYKHLENEEVYTYKQNYASIFESLGIYKTIGVYISDHTKLKCMEEKIIFSDSDNRVSLSILKKDIFNFYKENL